MFSGAWFRRLFALRNRIVGPRSRAVFNRLAGAALTRFYAEAFKDLAVGVMAGLVAGVIAARLSEDWELSLFGATMVIMAFGWALMALSFGGVLAVSGTVRDVAAGGEAAPRPNEASAVIWVARLAVWVSGLALLGMTIWGLRQLWRLAAIQAPVWV